MTLNRYKPAAAYDTTKDIVGRLVAPVGVKHAAHLLDRRDRVVYDYLDPDSDTQMTFDQVRRLTEATDSVVAAEALAADAGGVFVPGTVDEGTFADLAGRVFGESGQLSQATCHALTDGVIDAHEHAAVRRELDDLIRLAVAARARLEADAAAPQPAISERPAAPRKPRRGKRA